jgi:hypothetical protein
MRRKDLTRGHGDRSGTAAFGALFENWTIHEVLAREQGQDRLIVCPVRDLLNWFSSWWYCPNDWPGEVGHGERVDVWRTNAQALLDQTPGVIFIKFNEWFSSEEYRRGISKQLGRPFTDKALRLRENYRSTRVVTVPLRRRGTGRNSVCYTVGSN